MMTLFKGDIVQCTSLNFGKVWNTIRLPVLYDFYTVHDSVRINDEPFMRIVLDEHLIYQSISTRYLHSEYGHLKYLKDYAFPLDCFTFIITTKELNKQIDYILNPLIT